MTRSRILLLTQWFDPEPIPKGLAFARELVAQGFEVDVLTGFPNYPGGRVYPGYRIRALQRESIDGVQVTRVPLYPSHDRSALGRVANYLSFAFASAAYGLFARRPDVIYAYHPPLTVGLTAALLRWTRRVPVVYDVQDLWPDTLRATGMLDNRHLVAVVGWVCRWVYARVDRIVVLSEGFRRTLLERGVPAEKVAVIRNWCDEAALGNAEATLPDSLPGPETFRIVFAGNMGKAQALDTVLEAAAELASSHPAIRFVLVGSGVELERLKAVARERALHNVAFVPRLPMSEVGAVLRAADVLLVHLRDDPLFAITIPSKTQAYMAIGRPILMGVRGDSAQLVAQADCGMAVPPEDGRALAQAAIALHDMDAQELKAMGENGRRYYAEHLSLRVGVERFATLFRTLAGRGRARTTPGDRVKRGFDVLVSGIALVALAPLLAVLALLVRRKLGAPALFRQLRPGLHGRPFEMVKLRTMRDAVDEHGRPLPDSQRLTSFGRLLRSTSLDELPELWNVLKGDMSLVGPRPLLMEYLPLYTEEQSRRHEVRPGITGWAQVNGRNAIDWEEKFAYDVWYVDNRSFRLDLRILFLTVKKILIREGISAGNDVTMPRFTGTRLEERRE